MNKSGRELFNQIKRYLHFISKLLLAVTVVCIRVIAGGETVMAYEEIVVVIDPGHGGEVTEGKEASNGGAMYHDLYEKDINLITAKAIRDELETYENVTVYLTREDDRELTLDARVDYAQSLGADFLISVHYNASENHNFFGSEIFVSAFGECYSRGYDMADSIMLRWLDYGNIRKDIKTRIGETGQDYYGIIRLGQAKAIPTIILEHGYLDNDKDFLRMKDEFAWVELGKVDAQGIADYYGLSRTVVRDSIKPVSKTKIPDEAVMPDSTGPENVQLTIDSYDIASGEVKFTLSAVDKESKLMFYGFVKEAATEETVFTELELWKSDNGKISGSYNVGKGYKGPITATVFNVYNIDTKSNVCELGDDSPKPGDNKEEPADSSSNSGEITSEGNSNSEETPTVVEELDASKDDVDSNGAADEADDPGKAKADKDASVSGNGKDSQNDNSSKESGSTDNLVVTKDKYYSKGVSDEVYAKAIEDSVDSTVEKSFIKLMIVGLILAMAASVCAVIHISKAVRKAKRRRKDSHNDGYDW